MNFFQVIYLLEGSVLSNEDLFIKVSSEKKGIIESLLWQPEMDQVIWLVSLATISKLENVAIHFPWSN